MGPLVCRRRGLSVRTTAARGVSGDDPASVLPMSEIGSDAVAGDEAAVSPWVHRIWETRS